MRRAEDGEQQERGRVEGGVTDSCEKCASRPRVDGWRFCRVCLEANAKNTVADRKRKAKEGRQRIGSGSNANRLLSADCDEQIGGMSRCVRSMEDAN